MRKIAQKALIATAVAATAAALTALPASAASPGVDISPGGSVTGTNNGPIAGLNQSRPSFLVCQGSTATGSVTGGVNLPLTNVATLNDVDFTNCVANNSIPTTVTASATTANPWRLDVTGPGPNPGQTAGKLVGVKVTLDAPSVSCTAVVEGNAGAGSGYIEGVHTNPANPGDPSTLTVPVGSGNNLVVTSASATCPTSLIQLGDTVTINGTYDLNPGQTVVYHNP